MNWIQLNTMDIFQQALDASEVDPVLFFKHSSRCSISFTALSRLERHWKQERHSHLKPYLVDLLLFRHISDAITKATGVRHESPQVIILHKGQVIYQATHSGIRYDALLDSLAA